MGQWEAENGIPEAWAKRIEALETNAFGAPSRPEAKFKQGDKVEYVGEYTSATPLKRISCRSAEATYRF